MIHFNCKACGVRLKCSAGRPGRTKRCPKCLKQVAVPESETPIPDSTNSGSLFNSDNSPASGSSAKIFFTCKSCGNGLNFPIGFAGRSVPCPKCLKQVTIPESETFGPDPANSDNPFNSDDLDATVTDAVTESTEPNQTKGTLGSLPSADEAHLTPFLLRRIEVPNEIVYFVLYIVCFVLFFCKLAYEMWDLFNDPKFGILHQISFCLLMLCSCDALYYWFYLSILSALKKFTEPNQTAGTLESLNNSPSADEAHLTPFHQRIEVTVRMVCFVLFFCNITGGFWQIFNKPNLGTNEQIRDYLLVPVVCAALYYGLYLAILYAVKKFTEPNQTTGTLGPLNNLHPADVEHLNSYRQNAERALRIAFFVLLAVWMTCLFHDPKSWINIEKKQDIGEEIAASILGPIFMCIILRLFLLFIRYLICKAYTWYGYTKKCPSCSRLWAKKFENKDLVNERGDYMTVVRRDSHRNSKGQEVGHTHRQEQVHVVHQTYVNHYTCSFCPHRWTRISTETFEG